MFVVLFSTGSESSTYIIAFIGVAILVYGCTVETFDIGYCLDGLRLYIDQHVSVRSFPEIHTSALCIPVCVKSVALYADLAKADI